MATTAAAVRRFATRHVASVVIGLAMLTSGVGAESTSPILYRIFLADGKTLTSYGDYARVGDRVVFSLPVAPVIRGVTGHRTQLMSIPSGNVDWEATERYAETARYAQYAATRGEADYAALSADVARALNAIARLDDPVGQIAIARATRTRLIDWTRHSYGYRERDTHQIISLLDEAISGLSVETGEPAFALSLVAMTKRPPRMALRAKPSLQEIIAQALTAADLTPVPAERLSVLRTVVGLLADPDAVRSLTRAWAKETRRLARGALGATLRVERAYAKLTRWSLGRAAEHAAEADVRGVRSVVAAVHERDQKLGHTRPDRVTALLQRLDQTLRDAERLQLARDRWTIEVVGYQRYRDVVARPLDEFRRAQARLDDIRLLSGPAPERLLEVRQRLRVALRMLVGAVPPPGLASVHELFNHALMLARSAADTRHAAVEHGDLAAARNASAAASGSIMLFERAVQQLDAALRIPELEP